jgi:predicted DCC family thiol-disulfide oxidoreductase YuxK
MAVSDFTNHWNNMALNSGRCNFCSGLVVGRIQTHDAMAMQQFNSHLVVNIRPETNDWNHLALEAKKDMGHNGKF